MKKKETNSKDKKCCCKIDEWTSMEQQLFYIQTRVNTMQPAYWNQAKIHISLLLGFEGNDLEDNIYADFFLIIWR